MALRCANTTMSWGNAAAAVRRCIARQCRQCHHRRRLRCHLHSVPSSAAWSEYIKSVRAARGAQRCVKRPSTRWVALAWWYPASIARWMARASPRQTRTNSFARPWRLGHRGRHFRRHLLLLPRRRNSQRPTGSTTKNATTCSGTPRTGLGECGQPKRGRPCCQGSRRAGSRRETSQRSHR